MRCIGTTTGKIGDTKCIERIEMFVSNDNYVMMEMFTGKNEKHKRRDIVISGDVDFLVDAAHQLIAAALLIRERESTK